MTASVISMTINEGEHKEVEVSISSAQLHLIEQQFMTSAGWRHFVQYCEQSDKHPDVSYSEMVDAFEAPLLSAISEFTKYSLWFFWPVVDALRDCLKSRQS